MKRNDGNTVIGYDLNDSYAQISYLKIGAAEPETASQVLGADQYNIPVAIMKKPGTGLWLYGKEALGYAEGALDGGEVIMPVTRLLDLAVAGTEIMIGDELTDPVSLLALFIKRSLSILTIQINVSNIAAFMFTTPILTPRIIEVINRAAGILDLPAERVYLQGYRESMYQYIIHQPAELYKHHVFLFDFSSHMKVFRLESNKKTTPTVVFIESDSFPALLYKPGPSEKMKSEWDEHFLKIAMDVAGTYVISSVYLIGEGFKDEWARESLKYLCRGRRVFRGNNLYSKGACFGALEKFKPTDISESLIFLGEDKLKSNVGIKLLRNGKESYYAVLNAGVNWYECSSEFEIILDEGNELIFIVTSLTGGIVSERVIELCGLPERPPRTSRLNVSIRLLSAENARITITDLGFGDLFPAGDKEWVREVKL